MKLIIMDFFLYVSRHAANNALSLLLSKSDCLIKLLPNNEFN
jgi:hypothetical protein